jgi:MFS family permease
MTSATTEETPALARPALTILAVCLAVLIVPLGLSAPPVALPAIGQDLHAATVPLQWVVNSYNVMAASLMMAAGSVADLIGRKRVFMFGVAFYGFSSLLAALAPNVVIIDIARGLGGISAAAVMTAGAASLAAMFEGAARIRAFAFIGVTIGVGLALGPSTSGLLISTLGWRSIFYAQVILVVISLFGFRYINESRNPDATKVDWGGTITFTGALFLFTLAIVEGAQLGWGSLPVLGMFVGSALLLGGFVIAERRTTAPMFNLTLFREPRFLAVNLLATAVSFGFVGLMVLLPSYLIGATGVSNSAAGLTMLILTGPVLVFPLISGRLVQSGVPMRLVLGVSLLIVAAGCAWLTVINPSVSWVGLLGPLLTIGIGIGLIYGLMDGAAASTVESARVGMAVGMFNTIRLASEAIAVAVMVAATVSLVSSRIADGFSRFAGRVPGNPGGLANSVTSGNVHGPASQAGAGIRPAFTEFLTTSYTGGLRVVLWVAAAICALSGVAIYRMLAAKISTEEEQPAEQSEDRESVDSTNTNG